jgi:hypothetical protein
MSGKVMSSSSCAILVEWGMSMEFILELWEGGIPRHHNR